MERIQIVYVGHLFRVVIAAWYDPILSPHGCLVELTILHWFFCQGVFHHPVWFIWFVGVFSITPFNVYMIGLLCVCVSLGRLGDLCTILSASSYDILCASLVFRNVFDLFKAFAELCRVNFPSVGILSGSNTSYIYWRSYRITVLILLYWKQSMVLFLLLFGKG